MGSDDREIILDNYIERVMSLQRARVDALSLADLKQDHPSQRCRIPRARVFSRWWASLCWS